MVNWSSHYFYGNYVGVEEIKTEEIGVIYMLLKFIFVVLKIISLGNWSSQVKRSIEQRHWQKHTRSRLLEENERLFNQNMKLRQLLNHHDIHIDF